MERSFYYAPYIVGGEMEKENKDNRRLFDFVDKQTRLIQKQVLDLIEVSVPVENWKAMRSKILGITSDFRRNIENEISINYKVKFDPDVIYEDVVRVYRNLKR
jgi:hypothetical protein